MTCDDMTGSTKTAINAVESQWSSVETAAAAAAGHSLYVVGRGELATSCAEDWPSQQQLVDVSSIIVSLFSSILGPDLLNSQRPKELGKKSRNLFVVGHM